jgi:6-pyruvoyltetrahydropterin/6-carboxytetrahydropterin synthase
LSHSFSVKVQKQYFNFAASHFLIFKDGSREPLHGHNYRVIVQGNARNLQNDMVIDFLDLKPIVREACNSLDHKLLLPQYNPQLIIEPTGANYLVTAPDKSTFSFPQTDVLVLPLTNTSAENLAVYLAEKIKGELLKKFQFTFTSLEVEVEETPGQSAIYVLE